MITNFRLPTDKLQIALSMKIFFHGREVLCFIVLLSRLFQMLVSLKVKVHWPGAVFKEGI